MQVICKNPKTFKLTQGNVYTVILEKESSYTIINDNNSSQNYSKTLFDEFEIPTPIVPPPPPVVRRVSEEDVLETIVNDYATISMNFQIDDYEYQRDIIHIILHNTSISCGIMQFMGLNDLADRINTIVDELISSNRVIITDIDSFKTNIFKKCIEFIIQSTDSESGIVICSTNTNNTYFDIQNTVISNLPGVTSCTHLNSNSSNHIIIWNIPYTNA